METSSLLGFASNPTGFAVAAYTSQAHGPQIGQAEGITEQIELPPYLAEIGIA